MRYTKITNNNVGLLKEGDKIMQSKTDLEKETVDQQNFADEEFVIEKIHQGSIEDGVALPGLIDQEYQVSNNAIEEKALSRKDLLDNWWVKE